MIRTLSTCFTQQAEPGKVVVQPKAALQKCKGAARPCFCPGMFCLHPLLVFLSYFRQISFNHFAARHMNIDTLEHIPVISNAMLCFPFKIRGAWLYSPQNKKVFKVCGEKKKTIINTHTHTVQTQSNNLKLKFVH